MLLKTAVFLRSARGIHLEPQGTPKCTPWWEILHLCNYCHDPWQSDPMYDFPGTVANGHTSGYHWRAILAYQQNPEGEKLISINDSANQWQSEVSEAVSDPAQIFTNTETFILFTQQGHNYAMWHQLVRLHLVPACCQDQHLTLHTMHPLMYNTKHCMKQRQTNCRWADHTHHFPDSGSLPLHGATVRPVLKGLFGLSIQKLSCLRKSPAKKREHLFLTNPTWVRIIFVANPRNWIVGHSQAAMVKPKLGMSRDRTQHNEANAWRTSAKRSNNKKQNMIGPLLPQSHYNVCMTSFSVMSNDKACILTLHSSTPGSVDTPVQSDGTGG